MAQLICPSCGAQAGLETTEFACVCGDLFDVVHSTPPPGLRALFDERRGIDRGVLASGVWRFHELIYPGFALDAVVTLQEGNTGLYDSPRLRAFTQTDELLVKHEGQNPTGSFKDRGMTVAVSQVAAGAARCVVCASTGNTAASMAAYAAHAGLDAVVLVPAGFTALGKLSQAIAHGARVLLVRGSFDDAMRLVREVATEGTVALVNSIFPFRVEGQKSILFEILQQLAWDAPDWLVFPAGNLGNCAAFGKALREAQGCGLIARPTRLAAIQAAGAAPFQAAFERGFDRLDALQADTLASAIRIGAPVSYPRAVRAIRASDGVVASVTDAEILAAKSATDASGLGAEPASCASLAGLRKLRRAGVIKAGERVVALLTGHLLKDPDTTLAFHRGELSVSPADARPLVTIDPDVDAVRAALTAGFSMGGLSGSND